MRISLLLLGKALMRVIGTIEARMGSTRLPGKTLKPVYGNQHLLACVVHRFRMSKEVEEVVVATTTSAEDNAIVSWCEQNRVPVFRGSENDVLDRVVKAALRFRADAIVQMGADSAYLDHELIDLLVRIYRTGNYDYVCNDLRLTYPLGIYGHVVNVATLANLNQRAELSVKDREDVVRHIFEHHDEYHILNVEAEEAFRQPHLRLTIDYPEDMELAREIYRCFRGPGFTTRQIIELQQQQPALFEKTRNLVQRSAPHLARQNEA